MISIVLPTFNRKEMLGETIQAILNQTFRDYELIIVDNMSQDGTSDYVKSLTDQRIKYYRNQNHGIIAINRNYGIKQACGQYVAFCDDDDLWLPKKLQKQVGAFLGTTVVAVASNYIPIGDVRMIRKNLSIGKNQDYRDYSYEDILLHLNPIISSSVIVRRSILLNLGGFDESAVFRFIEDWELWLRVGRQGRIRVLAEPLLHYRMLKKSGRDPRLVSQNTLKILEKHRDFGFISPVLFKLAVGNCSLMIGKAHLEVNDSHGIAFFWRGFLSAGGFCNKSKSLIGILMFLIPGSLRKWLIEMTYLITRKIHD